MFLKRFFFKKNFLMLNFYDLFSLRRKWIFKINGIIKMKVYFVSYDNLHFLWKNPLDLMVVRDNADQIRFVSINESNVYPSIYQWNFIYIFTSSFSCSFCFTVTVYVKRFLFHWKHTRMKKEKTSKCINKQPKPNIP